MKCDAISKRMALAAIKANLSQVNYRLLNAKYAADILGDTEVAKAIGDMMEAIPSITEMQIRKYGADETP